MPFVNCLANTIVKSGLQSVKSELKTINDAIVKLDEEKQKLLDRKHFLEVRLDRINQDFRSLKVDKFVCYK
jgi:predicted nuclease with TOPRIM domain